jgi:hypothetical protein
MRDVLITWSKFESDQRSKPPCLTLIGRCVKKASPRPALPRVSISRPVKISGTQGVCTLLPPYWCSRCTRTVSTPENPTIVRAQQPLGSTQNKKPSVHHVGSSNCHECCKTCLSQCSKQNSRSRPSAENSPNLDDTFRGKAS